MIINGGNYQGGNFVDRAILPVTQGIKLFLDSGNPVSYPGDGATWYDLSGEGYTAGIQYGMIYSPDNGGVFNFNGSNGAFAQVIGGQNFNYDYSAGVTVNVWANFTTVDNSWERLIDFGNGNPQNNIILARRSSSNNLVMDIEGLNGDYMIPGDPTINFDQWAMYTMLADGTNWKMYKNGVFQCSEANTGVPAWTNRYNNYIGRSNWDTDDYFLGSMSVIQLYAYALTEDQIAQNFNAYRGRYGL